MNALKHGLFARDVRSSIRRLEENPQEFRAHLARFERCFSPKDEAEKKLVEQLAFAAWRRLRLFRAQAAWESARVKKLLDAPAPSGLPAAKQVAARGYALGAVFYDLGGFFDQLRRLQSEVESLLRALVRKRSGGAVDFRGYAPRRESKFNRSYGAAPPRKRTAASQALDDARDELLMAQSLRASQPSRARKSSGDVVDKLISAELDRRLRAARRKL